MDIQTKRKFELVIWLMLALGGIVAFLGNLGHALPETLVNIGLILGICSFPGLFVFGQDKEYHPHSIGWKNCKCCNPKEENEESDEVVDMVSEPSPESEPEAEANWWEEQSE